jgi:FSR family fosmidomycin resistance protein-like MFS transporter
VRTGRTKHSARSGRSRGRWAVLPLALGHAVDDFYPSFLAPLLPLFVEKLGLSLALAGGLATLQGFTTSLVQPLFGYLADRVQRPWLAAWGMLASAIFTSLWGLAPNGASLVLLVVLAGLGVALFHPVASGLVGQLAPRQKGTSMSLFLTGGSVGYGLGPLVAVALASKWGLPAIALTVAPGLLTALLLFRFARQLPSRTIPDDSRSRPPSREDRLLLRQILPLLLLTFVVMLRAGLAITVGTFLPLYLTQQGFPLLLAGLAVTIFRVAGAVGGLAGGPLSDRVGRRQLLFLSFAMALPFLWGFFRAEGWLGLAFLGVAGAVIGSSAPLSVVIAQEAAPDSPSMASGLMIGFAWGVGGLAVTGVGWWGDQVGLPTALSVTVPAMAAVASVVTLFLREKVTQVAPLPTRDEG